MSGTNLRLHEKVVLVTGAAQGMGEVHAQVLARHGAAVALADVQADRGERIAEELRSSGHQAAYVPLDVTNEDNWREAVHHVEKTFGGIDGLVNNAGIAHAHGGFEQESLGDWQATLAVNQTGPFLGMRAVVPGMRRRGGGSIVNVSSILGLVGDEDYFSYTATKGALRAMTRSAALKLATSGIRVNALCPAMVRTPMAHDIEAYVEATPMKRLAEPQEVSTALVFLLSDESSYMTGSDLVIDGGFLAR